MRTPTKLLLLATLALNTPAVASELFYYSFEPEAAVKNPSLEKVTDAAASGGQYVWMPKGVATYHFDVPVAGRYHVWARVTAYDTNNDSFYLAMDGRSFVWNDIPHGSAWHWAKVREGLGPSNDISFDFQPGQHTFVVKPRDHNSNKLDRLLITNDAAFRPSDGAMPRGPGGATLVRGQQVYLWIEAESGKVEPPFFVKADRKASGGSYVLMPDAEAVFTFTTRRPETVRLWGRVKARPVHEDSFAIRWNGGPWIDWHLDEGADWHWAALNEPAPTDQSRVGRPPTTIKLPAGSQRLELNQREHGAMLDRILITNDLDFVPGKRATTSAAR